MRPQLQTLLHIYAGKKAQAGQHIVFIVVNLALSALQSRSFDRFSPQPFAG